MCDNTAWLNEATQPVAWRHKARVLISDNLFVEQLLRIITTRELWEFVRRAITMNHPYIYQSSDDVDD